MESTMTTNGDETNHSVDITPANSRVSSLLPSTDTARIPSVVEGSIGPGEERSLAVAGESEFSRDAQHELQRQEDSTYRASAVVDHQLPNIDPDTLPKPLEVNPGAELSTPKQAEAVPPYLASDPIKTEQDKLLETSEEKKSKPPKPDPEYEDPWFTLGLTDKQQWIVALIVLALLGTIVPFFSVKNALTSTFKSNHLVHGQVDPRDPGTFEGVLIYANVTRVEHRNLTCTVRYTFFPMGKYGNPNQETFANNVKFITERYHITIEDNEYDPVAEVTYPITGLPVKYPFETYWADFSIGLYTPDDSPIPIALGMIASKQSWWGNAEIREVGPQMTVSIRFDQGWMTKIYAIFSSVTMWILTITLMCMTWTIFANKGKAESGIMRLGMRLLFAFPAMRRNQPGVVPMGCTEDILAFFWCMSLVAICMYLLVGNVVSNYIYEDISADKRMFESKDPEKKP
jgi:hypothetical protein